VNRAARPGVGRSSARLRDALSAARLGRCCDRRGRRRTPAWEEGGAARGKGVYGGASPAGENGEGVGGTWLQWGRRTAANEARGRRRRPGAAAATGGARCCSVRPYAGQRGRCRGGWRPATEATAAAWLGVRSSLRKRRR
jgi:hypothetical protein